MLQKPYGRGKAKKVPQQSNAGSVEGANVGIYKIRRKEKAAN